MTSSAPTTARIVFLFDVDNTLLDNDHVTADLKRYLEREVGPKRAQCYWQIFEQSRAELPRPQIVDAPVDYTMMRGAEPGAARENVRPLVAVASNNNPAGRAGGTVTDKQLKAIYAIARAARHLSEQEVDAHCQELYHCRPSELSKVEGRELAFVDPWHGVRTRRPVRKE